MRRKKRFFMACSGFSLVLTAFAAEQAKNKKLVIDVGQLEVEGELRRPQVTWIDSQKKLNAALPKIHAEQFRSIEAKLLAPLSESEAQARIEAYDKK